jgi:hypothetical protein
LFAKMSMEVGCLDPGCPNSYMWTSPGSDGVWGDKRKGLGRNLPWFS